MGEVEFMGGVIIRKKMQIGIYDIQFLSSWKEVGVTPDLVYISLDFLDYTGNNVSFVTGTSVYDLFGLLKDLNAKGFCDTILGPPSKGSKHCSIMASLNKRNRAKLIFLLPLPSSTYYWLFIQFEDLVEAVGSFVNELIAKTDELTTNPDENDIKDRAKFLEDWQKTLETVKSTIGQAVN